MKGKIYIIFITIFYHLTCFGSLQFTPRRRKIQTDRPIIGIVAQSTRRMPFENRGSFYISAAYVKFLEQSGARVVPIRADLSESELKALFHSINGAVLPGGRVGLFNSSYANTSRMIFNLARETFDNGGYFPIMGMCLGHQFLATVLNGLGVIRVPTDSRNFLAPLNLSKDYRESKLFRDVPDYLAKAFNSSPTITAHNHRYSLPVQLFEENIKVKNFYKVLTTNVDRKGKQFVSTMEARKYPFYSTQWHPEKCSFEWSVRQTIPHDLTAIQLAQYISNFFVNEAKFSSHKFTTEREARKALIYNYKPVYTGRKEVYYTEQVYIF